MEEELSPSKPVETTHNESLCVNCNVNTFEEGHAINLCSDCRAALINYPVPKWIKLFSLGLLAVIIISLIRTQLYISAAIHLGRAEKAIESKHFTTAQKELNKVLAKFPNDVTTNGNMIIASSYNLDFESARVAYFNIEKKNIEDESFFTQINLAMDYVGKFIPQDTIMMQKINAAGNSKQQLHEIYALLNGLTSNSENLTLKVGVASHLFELKEYELANSMMHDVLQIDPEFYTALSLMSAIKRNTGKYEEALQFCDRMLKMNREDVNVISQKARIELKRKHDKEAARYVDEAMQLNSESSMALEAKAMVDYFAGRKKECFASLATIKKIESATGDLTISKRLTPIINGTEVYR